MPRRDSQFAFTAPLDDEPMPPPLRRRGVKLFVAGVVLLVAGARVWWGHYADRRLQAAAAEWRAKDAALPQLDLSEPAVADEDNAAFYLRRAAGRLTQEVYGLGLWPDDGRQPTADFVRKIGDWLRTNPPLLSDVRRARSTKFATWGVPPRTWDDDAVKWFEHSLLDELRQLALTTGNGVMYAHSVGDDAAAVEWSRDVFAMSRALERQPAIDSQIMAESIERFALIRLAAICPELRVGVAGTAVSPQVLREVMTELLDTEPSRLNLLRAERAERRDPAHLHGEVPARWAAKTVKKWNGYENEYESPVWLDRAVGRAAWPSAAIRVGGQIRFDSAFLDSLAVETYPAAAAKFPGRRQKVLATGLFAVDWVEQSFQDGEDVLWKPRFFHARVAKRRVAAVALAVRLFQADHGDRLPATLAELVPAYLPDLPPDPMAADGRPVGYAPTGPVPCLYSIMADGFDNTAAGQIAPPGFNEGSDFTWSLVPPKRLGATPTGRQPSRPGSGGR